MIRSFLTVSSGTLASRLLGFARDSMVAALLGAGPVADAFLVAFQMVNVVRRLLTEGALNAISPLLFNGALIAVTNALLVWRQDAASAALVLAATVGIAGLLQLSILLLRRGDGVATWLRVTFDGEMRKFFAKAIPGMIASSGPQLLMVAGAIIASSSPSAVSWLYFANRLVELPLGLVGVAMGTVLIPQLSRAVHGEDA